jgi:glycosyltransferase involved in cell wall biosynthesis
MTEPTGLRVAVIHPGARMHYAVPAILGRAGVLARLYTDVCADVGPLGRMARLWPPALRPLAATRLAGRRLPREIDRGVVRQCSATAVADYILRSNRVSTRSSLVGESRLGSRLSKMVWSDGFGDANVLYTLLGNSDIELIGEARSREIRVVYEVATGPDVGLWLLEEQAYFPGIEPAISREDVEASRAIERLRYSLVDLILVPSEFTRKAVVALGAPPEALATVPYGLPEHWLERQSSPVPGRVLFVGIVELLKGVHYLAEAARILRGRRVPCHIRVVGPYEPNVLRNPIFEGPTYVGAVPRAQVGAEFGAADVLVLPTICDSFGLVQLEAMACGVPVITTPNAAALVRDGIEGFIVPIRDSKTLAARIEEVVTDRELRQRMGHLARLRAREFTWRHYGDRLLDALEQVRPVRSSNTMSVVTSHLLSKEWTATGPRPKIHVAILGARGHYAVPKLLQQSGMLGRFFTDVYAGTRPWLVNAIRAVPSKLRPRSAQRFLGRFDRGLPRSRVVSFEGMGAWYIWRRTRAQDTASLERVFARTATSFNARIARRGLNGAEAVYGCNGASVELFERARAQGLRCVLEQTMVPLAMANRLLKEEAERWPGWEPGLQINGVGTLADRERREWHLADRVIAGSEFVLDTLRQCGVSDNKCRVVAYGVPLDRFAAAPRGGSPGLRILFVGEVGLRKGVPYLLEALRALNSARIEVRAAGRVVLSASAIRSYRRLITFLGSVPRVEMPALFRWADVLVLPSICEGSAFAAYEALVAGIPVVATPNSGAPVRDGIDGLLVPIREPEALAGAIRRFLEDREFLRSCSQAAQINRYHLSLEAYRERLVTALRESIHTDKR